MHLNDLSILVFELTNEKFEIVGELTDFTSLIWPESYNKFSTFELWAPITEANKQLLKEDFVLWKGGDNAFKIEIIKAERNDDGEKTYHIKGRSLEAILLDRGNLETYNNTTQTYASSILYDLVNKNCINPTNVSRKIPYLINATDLHLGGQITYQKTGGQIYNILNTLAVEQDLGFKIVFDYANQQLIFTVYNNKDRSLNQNVNDVVFISSDFDDILSSEYYKNLQELKNVAFVHGELTDTGRSSFLSGEINLSGFKRKELYIDARDLQSEVTTNGTTTTLTQAEYEALLNQRGLEYLADNCIVETFDAVIRASQFSAYQYGTDYFLGDYITFEDYELSVAARAQVLSVEEQYSTDYELNIVFGIQMPTLISKLKSMIITN